MEYIKKQDVIDKIQDMIKNNDKEYSNSFLSEEDYIIYGCIDNILNAIQDAIDDIPTADIRSVVREERILRYVGAGHYWECSVCHQNPCIYV